MGQKFGTTHEMLRMEAIRPHGCEGWSRELQRFHLAERDRDHQPAVTAYYLQHWQGPGVGYQSRKGGTNEQ